MPTFRKKPVVVEAVQYHGGNWDECARFIGPSIRGAAGDYALSIQTLEGIMEALPGDWIIRGVKGEHYPCKPDIFAATYEPADSGIDVPSVSLEQAINEATRTLPDGSTTTASTGVTEWNPEWGKQAER